MAENDRFEPAESANKLRDAARVEVHGTGHENRLLDEFSKIKPEQLNDVARSLESGNSYMELSHNPQASIRRSNNGDVTSIEFHPGKFDYGDDPRSVVVGSLLKSKD